MDGTIINTEDLYTEATTELLERYGKGPLTWDVKIRLQGRPGPESMKIMIEEYDLPLTIEEFSQVALEIQADKWHRSRFLPGALELVEYLYNKNIPIALGTSSNKINFERKTKHLDHGFKYFTHHIVTGDDPRIPTGRGKPNPDIWFACLDSINAHRKLQGLDEILIEECLVFEDGIPGVVSGIAAKAHVIWIPDVNALEVLNGEEHNIIGTNGEILTSLEHFDKAKYSL
ncbi:HAD-like domain-containing protein [Scheffersomyces amazonensis]|uniref:HAD-like domain-containing protein n=1 Tax=Scheffersomyces amazonensis TaxID=1078765 RepID=UPI00315C853A